MSETWLRKKLCCIDLLNAVEDGYLDEVSSGLFFPNKEGHCKEGVPRIRFCPFCKAEIRPIRLEERPSPNFVVAELEDYIWDLQWKLNKKMKQEKTEPRGSKELEERKVKR